MTSAERNRRYRERHPERYRESQQRYRGAKQAKEPNSKQQRKPTEAQTMARNKWNRAEPGSVLATLNTEQRRAFQAWLKVLDKDVAEMERWGRLYGGK